MSEGVDASRSASRGRVPRCENLAGGPGVQPYPQNPENRGAWRLFDLQRANKGDHVVDVLLARRVVNRIEFLKMRTPDRHVFRTVCSKVATEREQRTNIPGGVLAF